MSKTFTIITPLSWVGNKSKACDHIGSTIPNVILNYYEPFLGSGSVLLYVLQQQLKGNITILNNVVVSDFNGELINFFKVLQQYPVALYNVFNNSFVLPYNSLESNEAKKSFYYGVRSDFNSCLGSFSIKQAARFLFLNKTSYGGLFRVNSKGLYNVPFGNRVKPAFPGLCLLMSVSKLINKVCFSHQKFNPQMKLYKGDFIYLDPPYVKVTKKSFVNYASCGFSDVDSLSLLNFCKTLTEKKCFFTLSNSNTLEVAAFAKDYKTVKYSSKSFKGNLEQLLITNSY
jgi:DNA adenine methylase